MTVFVLLLTLVTFLLTTSVHASTSLEVTSSLCTPTSGGITTLTGSNFNLPTSLSVTVGAQECQQVVVLSSSELNCFVPPGMGDDLPVVVNGVIGSNFSYCAPMVDSVEVMGNSSSVDLTVLLTGINFGQSVSRTSLNFRRPNDEFFTACETLTVVTPNTVLSCTLPPNLPDGEYFANLTVAGVPALDTMASFTLGICYSRTGISNQTVVNILQKLALQKNIDKLTSLLSSLKNLKASLPPYDGNDCCTSTYAYPLPLFELEYFTTLSFDFKDCVDSFCSQRESYLAELP